jgi:hypothetical protein
MLSQAVFNAFLLKTLEEPTRIAIFILATTEKSIKYQLNDFITLLPLP